MTRTFSANELSAESGVTVERIRWLVDVGIIQRRHPERFVAGDGFRAKMIEALLEAGVSPEQIEMAVRSRSLDLTHVDRYILIEPGPHSERTFAELMSDSGPRGSLLPSVYKVLGIPQPDRDAHLPLVEEQLLHEFLEAWRLAPEDQTLTRAARMIAEGTRLATAGWMDLFDEQVARPTRERLLRGEMEGFPQEVSRAVGGQVHLIPRIVEWLTDRYVQQMVIAGIVENLEQYLSSRGLAPAPRPGPPPVVAFVDLSGYTQMTEELGDEKAARTSDVLRDRAEAVADAEGGRLVKLLGDGAMLWFRDPARAVPAVAKLVRELRQQTGVPAHAGITAGPIIQRDRDLFGRTVNLAARIAGQAGPGEIILSSEVAELAGSAGVRYEEIPPVQLKGFDHSVRLFRLESAERA